MRPNPTATGPYHHPLLLLLFISAVAPRLDAQATDTPLPQPHPGAQIFNASAYAVYYSNGVPGNGTYLPALANLPSDVGGGGSIQAGWASFGERSSFLATYTASYTGRLRYSGWNALNHAFSLNATRNLAPRWTLGLFAGADASSLDQFLFSSTTLGSLASEPVTFGGLSSALLSGRIEEPQLAPVLAGSILAQSPLRALLYGERVFNAAIRGSLGYSYSPRLRMAADAWGRRSQHLSGPAGEVFVAPGTTFASGGLSLSYSLSPRTEIGAQVSGTQVYSRLLNFYSTTAISSLGWKLSGRWILQIRGGVGYTHPAANALFISTGPHPVGGGTVGLKTFSHTALGSYDRTVSDSYGLGSAISSTAALTWRWRRPGRSWWVESGMTWQHMEGSLVPTASGWRATAGIGRQFGDFILLTQYAYLNYSGTLQQSAFALSQSAVRVSIFWTPRPAPLP